MDTWEMMTMDYSTQEPPTKIELAKLVLAAQAGNKEAENKVVEGNLKLAFYVAKTYFSHVYGIDREDLIQEGVFALMRATQKFDPFRGIAYSTYATTWLRSFMARYIQRNSRQFPMALSTFSGVLKTKAYQDLESRKTYSLSREDEGDSWKEPAGPDDAMEFLETREEFQKLRRRVNSLPDKPRLVLKRRLAGETLEQIAQDQGITREGVRQQEVKALRILAILYGQSPNRIRPLKGYRCSSRGKSKG